MIEQLKTFKGNALAIEVIDGFTETDERLAQKLVQEKLDQGFDVVNVLVKLDEMKISNSSAKAFLEDTLWIMRNFKSLGNLAIISHSKMLKAAVPLDNVFFSRLSKGHQERYFDASQIDEAFKFISTE